MICFMDRTFCASPECKGECGRQWTPELAERAKQWWGGEGAPVSFGNFCSKPLENKGEFPNAQNRND